MSVVAGNNIYCPNYSLSRIPCNQIHETLLSKSSPHRVTHTVVCALCKGGFSLHCLNTGVQVFQIASAGPAENVILMPISSFH